MANFVFDALLVLILLILFMVGLKKGFVSTIAKPVKFVLALVISFSAANPVGETLIKPLIDAPVSNKIETYILEKCSNITAANVSEELPTLLKLAAGLCGVNIEEEINGAESVVETLVHSLVDPVITICSTIIAFILLYIASKIVLSFVVHIIDSVCDGGIVGAVNKILGVVFCTAIGFIACWCVVALSDFIFNIPAIADTAWAKEFTGWPIFNFFKSISPIDLLLSF